MSSYPGIGLIRIIWARHPTRREIRSYEDG
jgi:uncharacterized DUF497 family protein